VLLVLRGTDAVSCPVASRFARGGQRASRSDAPSLSMSERSGHVRRVGSQRWRECGASGTELPQGHSAGSQGRTLLSGESRLRRVSYLAARAQDTDDDDYCEAVDAPASQVVGKLGGAPLWIQADETPNCECGARMAFVAQLECSGGGGINFGDCGTGYAFVCPSCRERAKFLWQCG